MRATISLAVAQRKAIDLGVNVGDVILDKYRVESILGHGGMGVVAECIHLKLGERVAIKMLRPDVLSDSDAVERFQREAQAAAKLKSEYVARVTDVGTFSATQVPYMVMEFLEGNDLDKLISERGFLPVPWAVELMLQAAEALAEAHSINIVHRDVKPSNLFVTWRPDGSALIKVLDFGISKSPTGSEMQLTQTQSLLGTPAYMSPEQMRSARLVDSRSDVWSLGTVMYEIIEGHRPFEADSFSEMCVKVAVDEPAAMSKAPPALQQVLLRCLAKIPEQRYSSMAELGRDLIPFAPDPHQATMLVERMLRMLRRSQGGDWELSAGSIQPLRDRSAPFVLQPANTAAGAAVTAVATAERSQPFIIRPLVATIEQSPRPVTSRRGLFVWAAVLVVAAVAGILIGKVVAGGDHERAAVVVPAKVEIVPPDAAPAAAVAAPKPDEPVPVKPDPEVVIKDPKPKPAVIKRPIHSGTPKTIPKPRPDPVPVVPPPTPPVARPDPFNQRTKP